MSGPEAQEHLGDVARKNTAAHPPLNDKKKNVLHRSLDIEIILHDLKNRPLILESPLI